jgi:hypothetical protein
VLAGHLHERRLAAKHHPIRGGERADLGTVVRLAVGTGETRRDQRKLGRRRRTMPASSLAPGWPPEHPNEIERLEKYGRWVSETGWKSQARLAARGNEAPQTPTADDPKADAQSARPGRRFAAWEYITWPGLALAVAAAGIAYARGIKPGPPL